MTAAAQGGRVSTMTLRGWTAAPRAISMLMAASLTAIATALLVFPVPPIDASVLMFAGLYAVASAAPFVVVKESHLEVVQLGGLVLVPIVLLLSPGEAFWAVAIGAVTARFVVVTSSPLERLRRSPLDRHVYNACVDFISFVPSAVLMVVVPASGARIAVALLAPPVSTLLSRYFVRKVIEEASRQPWHRKMTAPPILHLVAVEVAMGFALAAVLAGADNQGAVAATAAATLLLVSRMGLRLQSSLEPDRELHLAGVKLGQEEQKMLEAVAAVAGPARQRVRLAQDLRESAAFRALVLASAGHDLGNRVTIARAGMNTLRQNDEQLDEHLRTDQTLASDDEAWDVEAIRRLVTAVDLAHFVELTAQCESAVPVHPDVGERILENLLRNADRYHQSDEPLTVCITASEDVVSIATSDRGPGLPTDSVERLFRPFTQGGSERDRHGGVGLGLYLARGFTEMVGGALRYEPREGGGSRFVIELPATAQTSAAESA